MRMLEVGSQIPATGRTVSPAPDRLSRAGLVVAAVEAIAAATAILLDLLIPSLVLIAMAVVSLLVRRQNLASLGLCRFKGWGLVGTTFLCAVLWSVFQLSVTLPMANHVSGKTQDLSALNDLQGNVAMLAVLLVAGWLLGGFAEELAYRGYLFTRIDQGLGSGRVGLLVAVLLSSMLFGFAHTEQGPIGVLIVTLDGIYFSVLRLHFKTVWASVLAHGFNNTIGFIAFFLVGPIYGVW